MTNPRTISKEEAQYMIHTYDMVSKTKDKAKSETKWVLEYVCSCTHLTKNWVTRQYTAVTLYN